MQENITRERSIGIDILKIISMLMVVIIHILGTGGVLHSCVPFSLNYYLSYLLDNSACCAVNCFALASGYIAYGKEVKYSSILKLWCQVVFICSSLTLLLCLWKPETYALLTNLYKMLLPVSHNQYWYFTAYFGMFFLTPLIHKAMNNISRCECVILLITILGFFSIYPFKENFVLGNGFSTLWLLILYFVGYAIRQYNLFYLENKYHYLLVYIIIVVFGFISRWRLVFLGQFLNPYTSIGMVLAAICLLLFCTRIQFRKKKMISVISKIGSLSFNVYLIHYHPLIWVTFLDYKLVSMASISPIYFIPFILGLALVIFMLCILLAYVRSIVFQRFHINEICDKIIESLLKIVNTYCDKKI